MNDVIAGRAPAWFRILAGLGLVWNLIGIYHYLVTVGMLPPGAAGDMPRPEMPAWVMAAFAVAVFAGALGSLGLLMLKRWATMLLILSLVAILAQAVWGFVLRDAPETPALLIPAAVVLIGILLVWLASFGGKKGWLS
jgi:hypothetical protein